MHSRKRKCNLIIENLFEFMGKKFGTNRKLKMQKGTSFPATLRDNIFPATFG